MQTDVNNIGVVMQTGVNNIGGGGGTIIFTPNKFSQPPVVFCQIIRTLHNGFYSSPVFFYLITVTKDCFTYATKDQKPGDRFNWIAIAS
jgi:hypothetical protein